MVYRKVAQILKKAGWVDVRQKGSHHTYKHPVSGQNTIVVDWGSKDLSIGVIQDIEKATGLSLRR